VESRPWEFWLNSRRGREGGVARHPARHSNRLLSSCRAANPRVIVGRLVLASKWAVRVQSSPSSGLWLPRSLVLISRRALGLASSEVRPWVKARYESEKRAIKASVPCSLSGSFVRVQPLGFGSLSVRPWVKACRLGAKLTTTQFEP